MPRSSKRKHRNYNKQEAELNKTIQRLQLFEEFEQNIAPQLRADLRAGMEPEELFQKYGKLAAARAITIALTEPDSSTALQALREVQDRGYGKPKEKKEHTHKYSTLPDQELDALLESKMKKAGLLDGEAEEDDGETTN